MDKYILITGGCGYIGSHVTLLLKEHDYRLIVLDDFSTGSPENKQDDVIYILGDTGDSKCLDALFQQYSIDTVMHFAAKISVEESEQKAAAYYEENVLKTITLIKSCGAYHIKNFFFSSTAAIYDRSILRPVHEDDPITPHNVYGKSKYLAELALQNLSREYNIQLIIFRYFNVSGHHASLRIGNFNREATALLPKICRNIAQKNYSVLINGDNYDTHDGTAIRDYTHVMDIAQAHLLLLQHILFLGWQQNAVFNIGYGCGLSVHDVIKQVNLILEQPQKLHYRVVAPREADIPYSVANNTKIFSKGWRPLFENPYQEIIRSELNWAQKYFATEVSI